MGQRTIYCVIPRELAGTLHDALRRHFRDEPGVEVIVERRGRERRSARERREGADEGQAPAEERRLVRAASGRRVGERRASLVPVAPLSLPRRLRRYEAEVAFLQRTEPAQEALEDMDTARLVTRVQAGDSELFSQVYVRYFERVYGYLRLLLRDPHDAEDATQDVFANVFEALPNYERRRQPFRAWLFVVVRNTALRRLRERGRLEPMENERLDRAREAQQPTEEEPLPVLDWITDPDLSRFVERLPVEHRQVLLLRYLLDLPHRQIAAILDKTEDDVRATQYRALTFLRERLAAIGRGPERREPSQKITRVADKANVLRARRYALYQ